MEKVSDAHISLADQGSLAQRLRHDETPSSYRSGAQAAWARLSSVALDKVVMSRNLLIAHTPSPQTRPIDVLADRVVNHMQARDQSRVLLTSPTAGCGTSTLLSNIALSIARRQNLRIMVFDFNFRTPSLIEKFDLVDLGPRFSALTSTRRGFDSTCLRASPTLALSLNATRPSNPVGLLGAVRSRDLIDQIEDDFKPDLMLFNTSALLEQDDTRVALSLVDQALLVALADHSTRDEIEMAHLLLQAEGKLMGVTLNRSRFSERTERLQKRLWPRARS